MCISVKENQRQLTFCMILIETFCQQLSRSCGIFNLIPVLDITAPIRLGYSHTTSCRDTYLDYKVHDILTTLLEFLAYLSRMLLGVSWDDRLSYLWSSVQNFKRHLLRNYLADCEYTLKRFGGSKSCLNDPCHLTKMAACPYIEKKT